MTEDNEFEPQGTLVRGKVLPSGIRFIEDSAVDGKGNTNGTYLSKKKVTAKLPGFSSGRFLSGPTGMKFEK